MDSVGGQRKAFKGGLISVKPFIGRIKFRKDDNQDFHTADRSVANAWRNHNGLQRLNGDEFTVEFELRLASTFENDVGFRVSFVVVEPRVFTDFGDVQGAGEFRDTMERSLSGSAGAGNAEDLCEVSRFPAAGGDA